MGEMMLLPRLLGEFEVSLATPYPLVLRQINREQLHELRDRYLSYVGERAETRYFTDKLPLNFWLIGLIEILFPGAPVIHAHRNPIDTGFSCYKQMFSGAQNFAYDLSEIKQYLLLHRDLMDYWRTLLPGRIFDLAYEDLVSSPEATVRAMLAFCELGWESQCLDFHQTRRAVKTSSSAQIRHPLHNDAVRFWKNYAQQLRELEGLE